MPDFLTDADFSPDEILLSDSDFSPEEMILTDSDFSQDEVFPKPDALDQQIDPLTTAQRSDAVQPGLSYTQGEEPSLGDKFYNKFLRKPREQEQAESMNWWNISKRLKGIRDEGELPEKFSFLKDMSDHDINLYVNKNLDSISRNSAVTGISPDNMTNEEYKTAMMAPLIATGIATAPLTAAASIGTFALLNKLIPAEKFIPENASDEFRTAVELADFVAKGAMTGLTMKGVKAKFPKIREKLFQTKMEEIKLPKRIKLTANQVKKLLMGGGGSHGEERVKTPEQLEMLDFLQDAAGKSGNKRAMREFTKKGVNLEIKGEKLIEYVDKPIWAKIKKILKIKEAYDMFPKDPMLMELARNRSISEELPFDYVPPVDPAPPDAPRLGYDPIVPPGITEKPFNRKIDGEVNVVENIEPQVPGITPAVETPEVPIEPPVSGIEEPVEAPVDKKSLNFKKVAELRKMLQEKGLPTTGKKAELIDRLLKPDTQKVNVTKRKSASDMNTQELVQYVKAKFPGQSAQDTYGRFVGYRDLKPEINMKEFRDIFNSVGANNFETITEQEFAPTHVAKDGRKVQVTFNDDGTKNFLFEDGSTGSHPLDANLPEEYKFKNQYREIGASDTQSKAKEVFGKKKTQTLFAMPKKEDSSRPVRKDVYGIYDKKFNDLQEHFIENSRETSKEQAERVFKRDEMEDDFYIKKIERTPEMMSLEEYEEEDGGTLREYKKIVEDAVMEGKLVGDEQYGIDEDEVLDHVDPIYGQIYDAIQSMPKGVKPILSKQLDSRLLIGLNSLQSVLKGQMKLIDHASGLLAGRGVVVETSINHSEVVNAAKARGLKAKRNTKDANIEISLPTLGDPKFVRRFNMNEFVKDIGIAFKPGGVGLVPGWERERLENAESAKAREEERIKEATEKVVAEQEKKAKERAAAPVVIEKGAKRAVYKIKVGADWNMLLGMKKKGAYSPSQGGFEGKGGVGDYEEQFKTKKVTSDTVSSALQQQLDDVQVDNETISGVEYMVISGIPKPMQGKIKGKLKGYFASKGKSKGIDSAEIVNAVNAFGEPFKLSEAIRDVIKRYVPNYGEGLNPKGTRGVLYHDTGNVFVHALNDIYTATHEVTHSIDKKDQKVKLLSIPVRYASNGNPIYDPKTKKLRKDLTKVYTNYYPGGRKDHKLSLRMDEGYAVFVSRAISWPEATQQEFPVAWEAITQPYGKLYNPTIMQFMEEARTVIQRYQALSPSDKIASRIVEARKEAGSKLLNAKEYVVQETLDDVSFMENLARKAGVAWTDRDPSLFFRMYRLLPQMLQHNVGAAGFTRSLAKAMLKKAGDLTPKEVKGIERMQKMLGNESFLTIGPDGSPQELYNFNWKTLFDSIEDPSDFDVFLVARLTDYAYKRLDDLDVEAIAAEEMIKMAAEMVKNGTKTRAAFDRETKDLFEILKERDWHREYLSNNAIDREVAEASYREKAPGYVKQAEMFDKLKRADWDMKHHPLVQLIDDKTHARGLKRDGYATMFREIENEIHGVSSFRKKANKFSKKIKSTFGRSGGMQDITGPLANSIQDHYDTFRKSWRQLTYNKLLEIIPEFPSLFQPLPLERVYIPGKKGQSAKVDYPQERDPKILMLRKDYKRYPVAMHQDLIQLIDEFFNPTNVGWLGKIIMSGARAFTQGTTSMNPFFALKNFPIDQQSAALNTKTGYIPLLSPIKDLYSYMLDSDSTAAAYAREYFMLAGGKHTFINLQYTEPKETYSFLKKEKGGIETAIDMLESGFSKVGDVFTTPVRISELMTRMSEYVRAREQGHSPVIASEMAGRVSIPFHHRGRLGNNEVQKTIVRGIPYFAARLQVLAQTGRSLSRKESRKRAWFVMSILTTLSTLAAIRTMKKGTPKQKEIYKNISVSEKSNYIWLPNPDGETLDKLPVANELTAAATIINMTIEDKLIDANYTPEEYLDGVTSFLPDQLNPSSPLRMATSYIPQILKGPASVVTNTKFWPKVTTLEPDYMKKLPAEERKFQSSSPGAVALSKFFRKKMGGNISPIQLDTLFEQQGGSGARFLTGKYNLGEGVTRIFKKEENFSATRALRFYYDEKDAMELQKNANKTDSVRDYFLNKKLRKLKSIGKMLKNYNKRTKSMIERGEDPETNKWLQNQKKRILAKINEYKSLKE